MKREQPESATDSVAEDGDFLSSLNTREKAQYERQQRFLSAYAKCGTVLSAAKAAGISRVAHFLWMKQDSLGFRDRFREAKDEFADKIEDAVFSIVLDPVALRSGKFTLLALASLNAHRPEKWRPNQQSASDQDAGKELIAELRKAMKPQPKPVEASTGEGSAAEEAEQWLRRKQGRG